MKWSLYLGKIAGIKIFIHWTFWILIIWIFMLHYRAEQNLQEALTGVLFVFALFACVVLHEFGHALMAKRFNIVTEHITLLPIGGVASMRIISPKPVHELLVAIAGPAVNVVIAIALFAYLFATGRLPTLEEAMAVQMGADIMTGGLFLFNLMMVNIILFAFNLIPAFPMDGGRVLRAILGFFMDRMKATRIAARIGQVLAILFVFAGFFGNFWLVFIGIFVFLGAAGEEAHETSRHLLDGYRVKDAVMKKFTMLSPATTLDQAVHILLNGSEAEFLVGDEDRVEGVLTRNNIIKGLSQAGKEAQVSEVLQKDFLRLSQDMELADVYEKLMSNGYSVSPVYQDSRLIGVLDLANINELIMVNKAMRN